MFEIILLKYTSVRLKFGLIIEKCQNRDAWSDRNLELQKCYKCANSRKPFPEACHKKDIYVLHNLEECRLFLMEYSKWKLKIPKLYFGRNMLRNLVHVISDSIPDCKCNFYCTVLKMFLMFPCYIVTQRTRSPFRNGSLALRMISIFYLNLCFLLMSRINISVILHSDHFLSAFLSENYLLNSPLRSFSSCFSLADYKLYSSLSSSSPSSSSLKSV